MPTVLYLIRHAHADYYPDEDRPLSAAGRAAAGRVADLLAPQPITAVYASPARRALDTVAPLAARLGLPVELLPDLRERELGTIPEGAFEAAVRATWDDPGWAWPGGETNAAAQRRGAAVAAALHARHPDEHVAAGTHGNLLALTVKHFEPGIDYAFWQSLTMPDVYSLELDAGQLVGLERLWQPAEHT